MADTLNVGGDARAEGVKIARSGFSKRSLCARKVIDVHYTPSWPQDSMLDSDNHWMDQKKKGQPGLNFFTSSDYRIL